MRWYLEDISELIIEYNKKYFHNKIKLPISVKWERSYKTCEATYTQQKHSHLIKINSSLFYASSALMKNTIVHELIHAWQAENEKKLSSNWHDDVFKSWCDKLNETGDFRYPLSDTGTLKEWKELEKIFNCAYYVYRKTNKSIYGVFINFLYQEEIDWLKNKGFHIKFYDSLKPTNNAPLCLKTDEFNVHFSTITSLLNVNITPQNIKKILGKNKIFSHKDFNFTKGINI